MYIYIIYLCRERKRELNVSSFFFLPILITYLFIFLLFVFLVISLRSKIII